MSEITKLALKQSLMSLLEEEPLESITINKIVNRCQLNRNTFYYHFHDIYELLDFVFTSEKEKLIEDQEDITKWRENLERVCLYLLHHKKMIYHVYHSIQKDSLEKYLYDVVGNQMKTLITKNIGDRNISEKTIEILVNFFKYALVGMFLEWIRTGMNDEILYPIGLLIDGNVDVLLDQFDGK